MHNQFREGRPVISSLNCHRYEISEYVDFYLQPIVKQIPSYVKDTTDILCKLDTVKFVPNKSYLVSLDVKSLYTSIPNAEGIKSLKESFEKHTSKNVATKAITTFLTIILTLNNFAFNSKHYLQIKACAMGAIYAQSTQDSSMMLYFSYGLVLNSNLQIVWMIWT